MKKLGFGLMRLPVINGDESKINFKEFNKMVDRFISEGFTYFDTAYFYHDYMSEKAFKRAVVKRYPRDAYIITTKLPIKDVHKVEDNEKLFNKQLKNLGVDYLDYYLMHAVSLERFNQVKDLGTFEFLKRMKKEGKVKHLGFSYHDSAKNLDYILSQIGSWTDVVQLQLNYLDWDSKDVEAKKCYEVCRKYKKKIIVMEPVKGGRLAKLEDKNIALLNKLDKDASPASFAVRYAASLEGVYMVLSGMSTIEQLEDNMAYMKRLKPINEEELKVLKKIVSNIKKENKIECTACKYCIEKCPNNIPIPELFKWYNDPYRSLFYYGEITKDKGKATDCLKCGLCESVCPQVIKIRDNLEKISKETN